MFNYWLYGWHILSDICFPSLVNCQDTSNVDIIIKNGCIKGDILKKIESGHHYEFSPDLSWFSNKTIRFMIENGSTLTYELTPGGNKSNMPSFILGWGMSMLSLQKNVSCMHCSAITDKNKGVLICGHSGSGKSTLTNFLLDKGFTFMADDIAPVFFNDLDFPMIAPAFPYRKLCRNEVLKAGISFNSTIYIDEKKDKFLVPSPSFYDTPVKAGGMIILYNHSDDMLVHVEELKGIAKFHACMENLFLSKILMKNSYSPEIGRQMLKLASKIPIKCIGRPDGIDTTSKVQQHALDFIYSLSL